MIRVLHLSRPSLTCARRSALGRAIEVGSNFFLFFASQLSSRDIASHADHSSNVAAAFASGNGSQPLASSGGVAAADQRLAEDHMSATPRTSVNKPMKIAANP